MLVQSMTSGNDMFMYKFILCEEITDRRYYKDSFQITKSLIYENLNLEKRYTNVLIRSLK